MPATRASSTGVSSSSMQQKRYRTPIRRPGGSAKSMKTSPHPEVIILSSEDENSPIVSAGRTKKPSRHLKKSKAVLRLPTQALGEVLEISDSDEVQPSPPAAKWKTERAAQELSELKSLEKAQAEEINALRSALSKVPTRFFDFSELEDHTLCEVCTHKMWKPYLLPDCGHCFCQDCLVGWFTTTQVKFMNSHPDYDPQHAMAHGQLHVLLKSIPAILNPNVRQQLKALLVKLRKMRPEYTCPSCRKTAVTKPVEDFRLKALVRHISDLQGEACPQESSPSLPSSKHWSVRRILS
ncbi:hypothetical protein EDD16DRAFT_1471574 [Pisolithus croceorrhizus]|nr:hypothetical protein EDD16DRAFT_1471574 [Pisolithus croceorrhizus]